MELYKDEPFLIYQDKDFFTEAVHYTARQVGMSAILVEKDYYCSVLLAYFYSDKNTPLVFKGGTSLSKIYADFYRMSEDLDFLISMPPNVSRSERSNKIAPIKELFLKIPDKIYGLDILEDMRGYNNSKQYIGYVSYKSKVAITDEPQKIKIEIGLREQTIYSPVWKDAGTLLTDPFKKRLFVPEFKVLTLKIEEAYAEKIRAALSRREPAIRDFYDINHAISNLNVDLLDSGIIKLVVEKLKVPGNDPIDISDSKKTKLMNQLYTQLKPVLRTHDFNKFDIEKAFKLVAKIGIAVKKKID